MRSADFKSVNYSHILYSTEKKVVVVTTTFKVTVSRKAIPCDQQLSKMSLEFDEYTLNLALEPVTKRSTIVSKKHRMKTFMKMGTDPVGIKVPDLTYSQWLEIWNEESEWRPLQDLTLEPSSVTIEDFQLINDLSSPLLSEEHTPAPSSGDPLEWESPPKLLRKTRKRFGGVHQELLHLSRLDMQEKRRRSSTTSKGAGSLLPCFFDSSTDIPCSCSHSEGQSPIELRTPSSLPTTPFQSGTRTSVSPEKPPSTVG